MAAWYSVFWPARSSGRKKAAQVDGRGDFHENVAGVFEQGGEQTQAAGLVLGAEEHVEQGWLRPSRFAAEKRDLRDDENRPVDRLLKIDQECERVRGRPAKPPQERGRLDQRQKAGHALCRSRSRIKPLSKGSGRPCRRKKPSTRASAIRAIRDSGCQKKSRHPRPTRGKGRPSSP